MAHIGQLIILLQIGQIALVVSLRRESSLKHGEIQLMELEERATQPRFGQCWTMAIKDLHWQCLGLNEEIQGRLALKFTNCLLSQAGHQENPCPQTKPLEECLKNVDDKTFTVYTTFFTHTSHMCNFLQEYTWQRESEKTMGRLMDASDKVMINTEESVQNQQKMMMNQDITMEKQRQSQEHGEKLEELMQATLKVGGKLLESIQLAGDVHQKTWGMAHNWFLILHSTILQETSGIHSVIYYASYVIVSYLFTTVEQIKQARSTLFILMLWGYSVEYGINQILIIWYHNDIYKNLSGYTEEIIILRDQWTWRIRKAIMIWAGASMIKNWWFYEDINRTNNALLQQILDIIRPNQEYKLEISQPMIKEISDESDDSYDSKLTDASWKCSHYSTEVDSSSTEDEIVIRLQPSRMVRERTMKLMASNFLPRNETGDELGHEVSRAYKTHRWQRLNHTKTIPVTRRCKLHQIKNCALCK